MRPLGKWCGPTALALVAGTDYSDAVERLKRRKRVRRPHLRRLILKGVAICDLGQELELLGARPLEYACDLHRTLPYCSHAPTLAHWLRTHHEPDRFTVLWLSGHYVTVWGETLCDNQKGATPLHSRFQRKRVRGWWRLPY